jgi:hypothetical protein
MLWFKKKINKEATEQFFKYLNITYNDGDIHVSGDITNEDIKIWLSGVKGEI